MKSSTIFDIYCKEISQFQFLSADKEAELLKEYKKTRSMKAQESIIHSHLRFVVSIALKYERISIDRLIDLPRPMIFKIGGDVQNNVWLDFLDKTSDRIGANINS